MKSGKYRTRLVWVGACALVCAAVTPTLAFTATPPDVDLSSVDVGDAFSSADGIEVVATNTTSTDSIDPPSLGSVVGEIGAPGQVGPGAPTCQFTLKVHMVKAKTSKGVLQVSANPALATSACSLPNTHMDAKVVVYHNGTAFFTAPLGSCALSTTDPCMTTTSQGSHTCSGSTCVGKWWGVATFDISLISGAFLVGQDSQCSYNNSTNNYQCVFTGNKVKM